ncbi:hypothetical protein [Afipia clevelandensis]|nr:hypothetical protein [Afipia clevelandensis]
MADGKTWKLIRDLGLVKGGKGLRCHEPIATFQLRLKLVTIHMPLSDILSMLTLNSARGSAA